MQTTGDKVPTRFVNLHLHTLIKWSFYKLVQFLNVSWLVNQMLIVIKYWLSNYNLLSFECWLMLFRYWYHFRVGTYKLWPLYKHNRFELVVLKFQARICFVSNFPTIMRLRNVGSAIVKAGKIFWVRPLDICSLSLHLRVYLFIWICYNLVKCALQATSDNGAPVEDLDPILYPSVCSFTSHTHTHIHKHKHTHTHTHTSQWSA